MADPKELLKLLEEQKRRKKFNKLAYFEPYDWQMDFMAASLTNRQKLAMCANQVGKTLTGACELAYHVTGKYPSWWTGMRFTKPIKAWACGMTNNSTRDVVQKELLGEPGDLEAHGTAALPLDAIGTTVRKPGIPNALDSVMVKHYAPDGTPDGWSKVSFMSYEMGQEKFMGQRLDWIWLDEEPPNDIFTQCVTRTLTTGGVVSMTFTPEAGLTEIVSNFMNNLRDGQFLLQATWEDVTEKRDEDGNITRKGHLTPLLKDQLLAVYSPHEREMRSKGIPVFGSGAVFPVHLEEQLKIAPFQIPSHWPRIAGLDFGWDHPTACVWLAWDRDTDTIYLYDIYKQSKATAVIHADAIMTKGRDIPVAWPKDGMQSDKGSGINLAEQYRVQGVNMLQDFFRNRPTVADEKGNFSIEAGVQEIYTRMENGTFRVFGHLEDWFKEFRQYYRDEGKIVPKNDDLMSATRYALCSADRYARVPEETGYRNMGKITYLPLGPGFK
jgi:phage terminase large subunit-like protein